MLWATQTKRVHWFPQSPTIVRADNKKLVVAENLWLCVKCDSVSVN